MAFDGGRVRAAPSTGGLFCQTDVGMGGSVQLMSSPEFLRNALGVDPSSNRVDHRTWYNGKTLVYLLPTLLNADLAGNAADSTLIRVVSPVGGPAGVSGQWWH